MRHRSPERRLDPPACPPVKPRVPRRRLRRTPEQVPGDVEIDAVGLRERQQPTERIERSLSGSGRGHHHLPELEVDAHAVGAHRSRGPKLGAEHCEPGGRRIVEVGDHRFVVTQAPVETPRTPRPGTGVQPTTVNRDARDRGGSRGRRKRSQQHEQPRRQAASAIDSQPRFGRGTSNRRPARRIAGAASCRVRALG